MTDRSLLALLCECIDNSTDRKEVKWGITWTSAILVYGYPWKNQEHIALIVVKKGGKFPWFTEVEDVVPQKKIICNVNLCKRRAFPLNILICLLIFKRSSNVEPGGPDRLLSSLEILNTDPEQPYLLRPLWAGIEPDEFQRSHPT